VYDRPAAVSESFADVARPPSCDGRKLRRSASPPHCGVRKFRRRRQPVQLWCQKVTSTVSGRGTAVSGSSANGAWPPSCAVRKFRRSTSPPPCGVRKFRRRRQPVQLCCQKVSSTVSGRGAAVSESIADGASPSACDDRKPGGFRKFRRRR
jgi:hypothetical protein